MVDERYLEGKRKKANKWKSLKKRRKEGQPHSIQSHLGNFILSNRRENEDE